MTQRIANVTLVVRDYDEAIKYYCEVLGFELLEDSPVGGNKRFVRVGPVLTSGACLLLAKAGSPQQQDCIGNQTGGRVFLFLHTDDFWRDYREYQSRGVRFIEQPRNEPYGMVVVFEDLYGNRWDLVEPTTG